MENREGLARRHAIAAEFQSEQNLKYHQLLLDLQYESQHWLSAENVNEKITESLFDKPSSTGVLSSKSELWRWHTMAVDFKRSMSKSFMEQFDLTSLNGRMEFRSHTSSVKRFAVEVSLEIRQLIIWL